MIALWLYIVTGAFSVGFGEQPKQFLFVCIL